MEGGVGEEDVISDGGETRMGQMWPTVFFHIRLVHLQLLFFERASVLVLYVLLEYDPSSSLTTIPKATPKALGPLVSMLHIESY